MSVIAACHVPGNAIDRLIESLDRQTMPQEDFEIIIVDDGSPDDTFARLEKLRSTRPNMHIRQIPNSGWPSRPRNVALELASGEYVYVVDDDDTLYPDALRATYEMATRNRSDVLSPKHLRNNDIGWGMSRFTENIDNLVGGKGIEGLVPMTPHKVYRRKFLRDHGIRFLEGERRVLWEDIYFNIATYRHAEVVSVLSDTPCYLWHSTAGTISKTYSAAEEEHWQNVINLLEFITTTLDGPEYEADRVSMILHQYRGRVLERLGKVAGTASPASIDMAMSYVRRIHDEYVPERLDQHLSTLHRARSVLLRAGRPDLLGELVRFDRRLGARSVATDVSWTDSGLRVSATCSWRSRTAGGPQPLRPENGRILRNVPASVAAALPRELVDVTDELPSASAGLEIRARAGHMTWSLPGSSAPSFQFREDGTGSLRVDVQTEIDLETSAFGRLKDAPVWDLYAHTGWLGFEKRSKVTSSLPARAALLRGQPGVAYSNTRRGLTIDLGQRLRTVVKDGRPAASQATGHVGAFVVPLAAVHVAGRTDLPCPILLDPLGVSMGVERARRVLRPSRPPARTVEGRLVGDQRGARLEAGGDVPAGSYRMSVPTSDGSAVTRVVLDVRSGGEIAFRDVPVPRPRAPRKLPSMFDRTRGTLLKILHRVARSVRPR
jgi:hypothetical protein